MSLNNGNGAIVRGGQAVAADVSIELNRSGDITYHATWSPSNSSFDVEMDVPGTPSSNLLAFRAPNAPMVFIPATGQTTRFQSGLEPQNPDSYDLGSPESGLGKRWNNIYVRQSYQFNDNHHSIGRINFKTEILAISTAATTLSVNQFPAFSLPLGVSVLVTTSIPTAATFNVGTTENATRYGSGVATASGNGNQSAGTTSPAIPPVATSVVITPNVATTAATGQIRLGIYYWDMVVPLN